MNPSPIDPIDGINLGTLLENSKTIFASKYKLYLPTEEELKEEAANIKKDKENKKARRKAKREVKKRIFEKVRYGSVTSEDQRAFRIFEGNKRCLRPHLFTRNKGYCNGCKWFPCCELEIREWRESEDQPERIELIKKTFDMKKKYMDVI